MVENYLTEKDLSQLAQDLSILTQNIVTNSQKYGLDPECGIRKKPIPDPGVKKSTGSRIRNTAYILIFFFTYKGNITLLLHNIVLSVLFPFFPFYSFKCSPFSFLCYGVCVCVHFLMFSQNGISQFRYYSSPSAFDKQ